MINLHSFSSLNKYFIMHIISFAHQIPNVKINANKTTKLCTLFIPRTVGHHRNLVLFFDEAISDFNLIFVFSASFWNNWGKTSIFPWKLTLHIIIKVLWFFVIFIFFIRQQRKFYISRCCLFFISRVKQFSTSNAIYVFNSISLINLFASLIANKK